MAKLHDLIDALRANRVATPEGSLLAHWDRGIHEWTLTQSMEAMCFDAGPIKEVIELNLKKIPELFKIPYESTWIEAETSNGTLSVLIVQVGENEYDSVILNKIRGQWFMLGVVKMRPSNESPIGFDANDTFAQSEDAAEYCVTALVSFVYTFLMALNCANVKRVIHQAPNVLNKHRARKGRCPIHEYWTLHISAEESESKDIGGTHASPRLHLRRGHIRRLSTGKHVWVQACVVGNKKNGIVEKDYRVHSELRTHQ